MPSRAARRAAATNAPRTRNMAAGSIARGGASPSRCAMADGASVIQPCAEDAGINCPPSQGTLLEPLRPACASCNTSGVADTSRTAESVPRNAASVASSHSPRSAGVMRPTASTAVASMNTTAAPDSARDPRCTVCQELATPSFAMYWHIGDTAIRFANFRAPNCPSENRTLIDTSHPLVVTTAVRRRNYIINTHVHIALDMMWTYVHSECAGDARRCLSRSRPQTKVACINCRPIFGGLVQEILE